MLKGRAVEPTHALRQPFDPAYPSGWIHTKLSGNVPRHFARGRNRIVGMGRTSHLSARYVSRVGISS